MKPGSFKFSLGGPNEALARSLSIKSTLNKLILVGGFERKLISVERFEGKCDFGGRVRHEFELQNYGNAIFTILWEAWDVVVWETLSPHGDPKPAHRKKSFLQNKCKYSTFKTFG